MQVQQTDKPTDKPICIVSGKTSNDQIDGCPDRQIFMGSQIFPAFVFVCCNKSREGEAVVQSCPRDLIPEESIPVRRRPEG